MTVTEYPSDVMRTMNNFLEEMSASELVATARSCLAAGEVSRATRAIDMARSLDSGSVEVLEASSAVHRRAGRFAEAMRDAIVARRHKSERETPAEPCLPDFEALQQEEKPGVPLNRTKRQVKQWIDILKSNRFFASLHQREENSNKDLLGQPDVEGPLVDVAKCVRAIHYGAGQFIFNEGDVGELFYVIFHGEVAITKRMEVKHKSGEVTESEIVLVSLAAGDSFGDFALDSAERRPTRSADAKTKSACVLLTLTKDDYRTITQEIKELEYAERSRWLRQCAAFDSFSFESLRSLSRHLTVKLYDPNSVILKQDEEILELAVIKAGVVDLFKAVPESALCKQKRGTKEASSSHHKPPSLKRTATNALLQTIDAPTTETGMQLAVDELYRPEEPGNWVLQRNWREIENQRVFLAQTCPRRQMLVGVLGRGQLFGELAVLDANSRAPTTAVSLTTVVLYTLTRQVIDDLELRFHVALINFLNRSLVLYNPPDTKLAEYHRNRESWKLAKDKVLAKLMSKRWIDARRDVMRSQLSLQTKDTIDGTTPCCGGGDAHVVVQEKKNSSSAEELLDRRPTLDVFKAHATRWTECLLDTLPATTRRRRCRRSKRRGHKKYEKRPKLAPLGVLTDESRLGPKTATSSFPSP
ncbi:hypothetical protein CTAYLR_001552 [Chrysophaeum taylorii]|uniref:Cyclic nucleotide-binding domain-containing protein n=1 Tax=Chrysophaeum taylorii TaxID=2483200 RepID=A0AAD7UFK1_9STRA|nr:hypothetical protein CTAYLR_001552 [Chrysophaeum taylorii]